MSNDMNRFLNELKSGNRIYYKILKSPRPTKYTIATLQWFDELDEQHHFITDSNGQDLRFETKEKAKEWLLKFIPFDLIDLS